MVLGTVTNFTFVYAVKTTTKDLAYLRAEFKISSHCIYYKGIRFNIMSV